MTFHIAFLKFTLEEEIARKLRLKNYKRNQTVSKEKKEKIGFSW